MRFLLARIAGLRVKRRHKKPIKERRMRDIHPIDAHHF